MKKNSLFLLTGLCATGLLSGFTAKRLSRGETPTVAPTPAAADERAAGSPGISEDASGPASRARGKTTLTQFPARHSTETVESLLADDGPGLYGRLATWMGDASEDDIAAYWTGYKQKNERSNDITDLVFLNWTRLNPQAAIAANAGSKEEHYAWWAWACHDPKASLAAALAANPDRVNNVAWGIGEFHPEWLRAHFKELPEAARGNAIQGMMKWDDGQNPLEALKFMKELGYGANIGTLKALIREDPWAALEWVKQNPGSQHGYNGSIEDPMQLVVKTMATEHPEDLARLVAQTPSGLLKLKMEAALFDNLLKTDPAAALEQAKASTAPRIAAERYAALGLGALKEDPERAFQLARDLFSACPDAMSMMAMVEYPNGSSGSGMTLPGVNELMESLSAKDPAKVLEMAATLPGGRYGNSAFNTLSQQWVERDVVGYSAWVNEQAPGPSRDQGAMVIANRLQNDGNYAEAVDWQMSTKSGAENVQYLLMQWKQADAEEAFGWLEASDLPAEKKARFKEQMEQQQ